MTRITKEEYLLILSRQGKSKEFIMSEDRRIKDTPKKSKYWNKEVIIDWIKFDSKKEGNRYCELKILERVGAIYNLQLQPKFLLLKWDKWVRDMNYYWDFSYIEKWLCIVEDVKSKQTQKNYVYRNKIKIFKQKYPDIVFKEIF